MKKDIALSQERRLWVLVGQGLPSGAKIHHMSAFRNALQALGPRFVERRMACETDEEELALTMEFAQDVVEEYLEVLKDRKSSRVARESINRRLRVPPGSRAPKKTKDGEEEVSSFEPYYFESILSNWMNPDNLVKKKPRKKVAEEVV